jgi:CRISPR-associated protein Csb2
MLALSLTFLAGRYHATPWDRHVNEGAVAWPPEPWRLLRALISTWHHKVKYSGRHAEHVLPELIESLARELPQYALPAATHSHTRHYMPQWKSGDTSLVFDAFTAVNRGEPLHITWPNLHLPADQLALLDDLLALIGYLGRAESWVEASRVSQPRPPNCVPGDTAVDPDTGELYGEVVTLFAPLPAADYQRTRDRFVADKAGFAKWAPTLPERLCHAISIESADLRRLGWSQPPAARRVHYLRPIDALRPKRVPIPDVFPEITTASYLLVGKPLPRVENSVRIGELLRSAVMSRAKDAFGEDNIPAIFSGHGLPEGNRHQHAFYLPWDANGDGRIDRVLIHVPCGLGSMQRRVIQSLSEIWNRRGQEWRLILEGIGNTEVGGKLTSRSSEWQSVTPYLYPWHLKKRFTIEDQIRRECRERGLPEPIALEQHPDVRIGNQVRRPVHFHRFRSKRGLTQPDCRGSFWTLKFNQPVTGPLALGFGCHFGLGLFKPTDSSRCDH